MSGQEEPGFVWPPRPVDPGQPAGEASVDLMLVPGGESEYGGGLRPFARGLRTLESELLGSSPNERVWRADPDDAACPRCGGPVGSGEVDAGGCGSCRGRRLLWERAVRLGVYEGPLREAILACKYRRDRRSGERLGEQLGEAIRTDFDRFGLGPADLLLVPVPTTTRRRLANGGLDHALALARGAGRVLGVRPTQLLERRHRARQAGLSASARARNLVGTIRARSARAVPDAPIVVLVDDVRTTGATATACFQAIHAASGGGPTKRRGGAGSPRFWLATAAVSSRRGPGGVSASGSGSAG